MQEATPPRGRGRRARVASGQDTEWAAPEDWKVEVFAAIRGLSIGRKIGREQAARAIGRLPRLGVDHVPVDGLLRRMWELRSEVRAYDAAYVALAEARRLTLVTSDGRLAQAATRYCRVGLVA